MNAFEILGVAADADEQQVRQAYHRQVKIYHPDQFEGNDKQQKAQEKMVQLNLAYEEALRKSAGRRPRPAVYSAVAPDEAKEHALRLLEQKRYESALVQLSHAVNRDGQWYFIHGQILMGMRQFGTAHQSFRQAVRLEPENNVYRQGALDAALAVKKHQQWNYRAVDWARNLLRRRLKHS